MVMVYGSIIDFHFLFGPISVGSDRFPFVRIDFHSFGTGKNYSVIPFLAILTIS